MWANVKSHSLQINPMLKNIHLFLLLVIRIGYPKIYHSSIWIILNKSYFRNSQYKKDSSPPLSPEAGNKSPLWNIPSLHQEVDRHPYCQRWEFRAGEAPKGTLVTFTITSAAQILFRILYKLKLPNRSTPCPVNSSQIYVSVSKMYKSYIPWSFLWVSIFILGPPLW